MTAVRAADSSDQLIARLTTAGFADVAIQDEHATFAYASPEEWWRERWSLYFRLPLESLQPDALAALEAEAVAHAREMQAQGELRTERTVLYTVANKPSA